MAKRSIIQVLIVCVVCFSATYVNAQEMAFRANDIFINMVSIYRGDVYVGIKDAADSYLVKLLLTRLGYNPIDYPCGDLRRIQDFRTNDYSRMATQKPFFVLVDRATYDSCAEKLDLVRRNYPHSRIAIAHFPRKMRVRFSQMNRFMDSLVSERDVVIYLTKFVGFTPVMGPIRHLH